jgi:hypothetical protein
VLNLGLDENSRVEIGAVTFLCKIEFILEPTPKQ